MHAVHIESSFGYPSIRDHRAVGLVWARRRCHSHEPKIVRGFRVVVVRGTVLAVLGEAVWSELVVEDSVECVIDSTGICALDDGTVVCALDNGRWYVRSMMVW